MKFTEWDIQKDIQVFNSRIKAAQEKLDSLPTAKNWKQRRKLNITKQALVNEIAHIKRIRSYAQEALTEG